MENVSSNSPTKQQKEVGIMKEVKKKETTGKIGPSSRAQWAACR